ncbi:indole-3-glycerol phosphate synthase TrpC [Caldinitratiruptor microaerophilus]|uniref:Indole-3-glycerol phosphate synthase n=1 Tax=Caldinitratiruptor microaerophilus TaxID=671077 RepID=A0AA35G852_9FIRM|nr:indole-3-glycerol phosphate synthase TrpC [Caldinitratiruptor microaerophilus]BDG60635.1 indole-3-glycerol phosphate synthase [Caldinitratiruptor microaerophilus]
MILDRILAAKAEEVAAARARRPLSAVEEAARAAPPPRDFAGALRPRASLPVAVIAEVKKASPSRGVLRADFDPVAIARGYQAGGAAAVSVLTDGPFFQGSLDHLRAVRQAVGVPLLRKDFLLEPYQVYEARAAGADAVLLIVAARPDAGWLREMQAVAAGLGMAALVEVHTAAELELALAAGARVVGINNRDLRTFETRLEVTLNLAPAVPPDVTLVSESGIRGPADCRRLAEAGVHAVLVGEHLVREPDPGAALRSWLAGEGEAGGVGEDLRDPHAGSRAGGR